MTTGGDRNYIAFVCRCPRLIRMSPKTAQAGPVICSICKAPFAEKVKVA